MEENLYPVNFKGKVYYEEDCDPLFVAFYTCREALLGGAVYVTDGLYIFPDGASTDDWEEYPII